jgi:hypothetical protein
MTGARWVWKGSVKLYREVEIPLAVAYPERVMGYWLILLSTTSTAPLTRGMEATLEIEVISTALGSEEGMGTVEVWDMAVCG